MAFCSEMRTLPKASTWRIWPLSSDNPFPSAALDVFFVFLRLRRGFRGFRRRSALLGDVGGQDVCADPLVLLYDRRVTPGNGQPTIFPVLQAVPRGQCSLFGEQPQFLADQDENRLIDVIDRLVALCLLVVCGDAHVAVGIDAKDLLAAFSRLVAVVGGQSVGLDRCVVARGGRVAARDVFLLLAQPLDALIGIDGDRLISALSTSGLGHRRRR